MANRVEFLKREECADGGEYVITQGNGHILATMAQKGLNDTTLAHAQKMAAADELYKALKNMRDVFDMVDLRHLEEVAPWLAAKYKSRRAEAIDAMQSKRHTGGIK